MSLLVLYSTGCPKCKVLKKKLEAKGLEYEECNDTKHMEDIGITQVPVLAINGELLPFVQANDWINKQN